MSSSYRPYPTVSPQANFPLLEREILTLWKENGIFQRSVLHRPAKRGDGTSNEFVFYDGPPFANGLPHPGHLLTGYIKDAVPRYMTMRGRRVERRFGWDCHGLPAEMEAEKQLKVSGRASIIEFGVDKFNEFCRSSVMKYTSEWEAFVTRQARWVDFHNDYKTMDTPYMESVIWAFKKLWEKGLIYEGLRVVPYSWACETPVSYLETRLDNAYRERQDPAVTIKLPLHEPLFNGVPASLLIWTTTPWTLPSNYLVAVNAELDYVIMEHHGTHLVISAGAHSYLERELKDATNVATVKGATLVGKRYRPPFSFFEKTPEAFEVVAADFVVDGEGTGLVHLAPFGEDDFQVLQSRGVRIQSPVDAQGKFTAEVSQFEGLQVFDANKPIIQDLKQRGLVLRHESYLHNYPHCWRTDTPLIFKPVSSWYVRVTEIRERMVEVNKEISWTPRHIQDGQFGKWLEGARDWSISRSRFWGTPLTVWKSDDPRYPRIDVYGSLEELERDFGVSLNDLHKPHIDTLFRPNPDDPSGISMMRRVDEVFDCWFESGSMPFAQVHYPFENKEWFEAHFPSDFISEYVAQTRGWFYTLVVLSTALFDKPPFRNCVCHGIVLDEEGKKLSKRHKNYPSPEEVFDTHGSDAFRWYLLSSSIVRGGDLVIDKEGKGIADVVRSVINPLWNAYYFFCLYANADGMNGRLISESSDTLDAYVLSKLGGVIEVSTDAFEGFDLPRACAVVSQFIDVVNNWYIRRSRERFWRSGGDANKQEAYDTLYTVLVTLNKLVAPLLPLLSEVMYRGLTGEESVHLSDWPDSTIYNRRLSLEEGMDFAREVCSIGLSLRERAQCRTRLPLSSLTIASPEASLLTDFIAVIREELNVKSVVLSDNPTTLASEQLQVLSKKAGPRLGKDMQRVIKAAKEGKWKRLNGSLVEVDGTPLIEGEFEFVFSGEKGHVTSLTSRSGVVALDTEVTESLRREGIVRDLIRFIQQSRRDAGLHVSDKIVVHLNGSTEIHDIVSEFKEFLCEQTLTKNVSIEDFLDPLFSGATEIEKHRVTLSLVKSG
jgi:isoleucyl-tRNA synthetase